MRLLRKQYYICVDLPPSPGKSSLCVKIIPEIEPALRHWGATTRISPIWQLQPSISDGSDLPHTSTSASSLWFLHGLPADMLRDELSNTELAHLSNGNLWLTLGVFNIVIISPNHETDNILQSLCLRRSIHYERWKVLEFNSLYDFTAQPDEISENANNQASRTEANHTEIASAFAEAGVESDDALSFMQLELFSLLSVVESRATGRFDKLFSDALAIVQLAQDLLNGDDPTEETYHGSASLSRPDILLTLNAGLSRHTSQALSGTSPILRTESHFWPHSLLGIGVASLALRNVAAFLTSLTQETSYDRRVYALKDRALELSRYSLLKKEGVPDFAKIDPKDIIQAQNLESLSLEELEDYKAGTEFATTPITYFSGRDGFLNSVLTASAPLPSIVGANSYQWNLGTITHEISHRILAGHISDSIEDFLDDMYDLQESGKASLKTVQQYFDTNPATFDDYARKLVGRTLYLLHAKDMLEDELRDSMSDPFVFFYEADERYSQEIEEILVHIFDYYHFYGEETDNYCNFIWQSWAVLPSIDEKVEEYVRRTLTAIGVKHLDRDSWKELAIADFRATLDAEPLASNLHLRGQVLTILDDEDRLFYLETDLDILSHLQILFHMMFKHDTLQQVACEELNVDPERRTVIRQGKKERRYYSYKNAAGVFVSENPSIPRPEFTNPLLFLRNFSREEIPNAAQSAWLLHMLAFYVDLDRSKGRDQL